MNLEAKFTESNTQFNADFGQVNVVDENTAAIEQAFADGQKAEYDLFWDGVQNYGARTNYNQAFINWGGIEYIRPKHKVIPTADVLYCVFQSCTNLKKLESAYFDFSQAKYNDTGSSNYGTFTTCTNLEEVEDLGIQAGSYTNTWRSCPKLKTIAVVRFKETTAMSNTFQYCEQLQNITIEGTIGQNGFNVSWSNKLTHDSLMSIISALKDYSGDTSGTEWVITIGSTNIAKLTADELNIAYAKGWEIY